jgi:hypothetical protein
MDNKVLHWELLPITAFNRIESHWDGLNDKTNNQSILSFVFVNALLESFSDSTEYIVLGWQSDELCFAGIFEKLSAHRWRTFQPSQAPLGCFLCNKELLNKNTCQKIANILPGKTKLVDFTQIDSAQHPFVEKNNLHSSPYISTGKMLIPKDFDGYFSSFSKNTRQNFNKARNRLAKANVAVKLNIITDELLMEKFIGIYGELESSGWKNQQGTAIHSANEQGKFYRHLFTEFAKKKCAQIWCYLFDDEIVAVDLCIVKGDVLVILKTTYQELQAKFSPALLMKLDAYKKLGEEEKIKTIEYFGPTKDWHKRLKCEERTVYHLTWCKYAVLYRIFLWAKDVRLKINTH